MNELIELGVSLPLDKLGVGSALLPVSAFGLGPPRPYATVVAGPGGTALWRGLQSCLTLGQKSIAIIANAIGRTFGFGVSLVNGITRELYPPYSRSDLTIAAFNLLPAR